MSLEERPFMEDAAPFQPGAQVRVVSSQSSWITRRCSGPIPSTTVSEVPNASRYWVVLSTKIEYTPESLSADRIRHLTHFPLNSPSRMATSTVLPMACDRSRTSQSSCLCWEYVAQLLHWSKPLPAYRLAQ